MTISIVSKDGKKPSRVFENATEATVSKVSFSARRENELLYIVYDYHVENLVINCSNSERANIKYRKVGV